jgi:hypothetical protein
MTALGFRVKSGYAIVVVLAGAARAPSAVTRCVLALSDPDVAETRQPYHTGMGQAEEDEREIARRVGIIERCARRSLTALMEDKWNAGPEAGERIRAGLVVGSLIDPADVGNAHIRAHANEGRLFRTVLEAGLRSRGIGCDVIVEKQLARRATKDLGRSAREIKRTLAELGRSLGSPWRAEEKAAATAAWLLLS